MPKKKETPSANLPVEVKTAYFHMFGIKVECSILDDGTRIVKAQSMEALFERMNDPKLSPSDDDRQAMHAYNRWLKGHTDEGYEPDPQV
jgi:uncharacterized protein (DUF2267 family)